MRARTMPKRRPDWVRCFTGSGILLRHSAVFVKPRSSPPRTATFRPTTERCSPSRANSRKRKRRSSARLRMILRARPRARISSGLRRSWHRALGTDHPGNAETIAAHTETVSPERFLHGQEGLSAFREQPEDALCFLDRIEHQREITAVDRLVVVAQYVGGLQLYAGDLDAGVKDGIGLFCSFVRIGILPVCHDECDLAAQMLLVKLESSAAVAIEVQIRIQFHQRVCSGI